MSKIEISRSRLAANGTGYGNGRLGFIPQIAAHLAGGTIGKSRRVSPGPHSFNNRMGQWRFSSKNISPIHQPQVRKLLE
jgi:hypothetical protein